VADPESKQTAEKTSGTNAGGATESGSGTEQKARRRPLGTHLDRRDTMSNPKTDFKVPVRDLLRVEWSEKQWEKLGRLY
jgi:hypothetical protein